MLQVCTAVLAGILICGEQRMECILAGDGGVSWFHPETEIRRLTQEYLLYILYLCVYYICRRWLHDVSASKRDSFPPTRKPPQSVFGFEFDGSI